MSPAGAAAGGGTLVWAGCGDIDTLDPHRATSTLSMQVRDQIHDTLPAFDDNGRLQPHVAKSWTVSREGLEYTVKLDRA